jgi:UrcA family protein
MDIKRQLLSTRFLIGSLLACALFTGTAVAAPPEAAPPNVDKHQVIVAKRVDTTGLDLNRAADAQTLYTRIRHAADDVCTRGKQVDLLPNENPQRCYEKALADAIRSASLPVLTQLYLTTHTVQEATARGIKVPPEVASAH